MSSSAHVDNKKKNILILGKGSTQGLERTLIAKKMYLIKFTVVKKKFCLSLHCNGGNSFLFVNGADIHQFKAKDSESETQMKVIFFLRVYLVNKHLLVSTLTIPALHPFSYKIGLIKTLIHRAFKISSSWNFFYQENKYLRIC